MLHLRFWVTGQLPGSRKTGSKLRGKAINPVCDALSLRLQWDSPVVKSQLDGDCARKVGREDWQMISVTWGWGRGCGALSKKGVKPGSFGCIKISGASREK